METSVLVAKLEKLPEPLKKEVEDFVDFLIFKSEGQEKLSVAKTAIHEFSNKKNTKSFIIEESNVEYNDKPKLKREFGGLKGQIWMSDDFDEPLEDFKNYM